ncbi:solute carrier organic anion transporter family member 5A1-like protein [Leptotrombidium deliense]|uniref:Solute carrier organic anion transporter family member 5A1-like protein n=1 Tax=Leptotrombidium deliense TaxID=299467 RepID=A0A443SQ83_9ACAR|nr:solute carrier organic anion transporter family member 5A1-like protein [Leptotrombidium deliense]
MDSNGDVNVPLKDLNHKEAIDETESSVKCGVFGFQPKWIQRLANPKVLLLNFAIVSVLQGSYLPYLVGSLTTLEKRYAYDGKLTGLILIADNFSSLLLSPIFGYLGNRLNRSRLLASGMLIVSFSCYLTTLPYFIYGATDIHSKNKTSMKLGNEMCYSNEGNEIACDESETTVWPAYITIWIASFLNGVGYTAFYTLSLPFVDDNVSKKNAPVYISIHFSFLEKLNKSCFVGILSTIRLIGPSFGFVCSSICLRLYEDPWNAPDIEIKDPRWIGAWWLGLLIIGSMLFICSLPLFAFPSQLKSNKNKKTKHEECEKENTDKSKGIIY